MEISSPNPINDPTVKHLVKIRRKINKIVFEAYLVGCEDGKTDVLSSLRCSLEDMIDTHKLDEADVEEILSDLSEEFGCKL